MGAKVRGVNRVKNNVNKLIDDIKGRRVIRALQVGMLIGGTQASLYTPIDTSTLLNSQFREIISSGVRVTGRVGYSAEYAMLVHDPAVKQKFRRATAQKEFLRKGYDDTRAHIDTAVKKELAL